MLKFSFLQNLFSLFSRMTVLSSKCIETVLDWATLFCAHNSTTILQINFLYICMMTKEPTYLPTYQSIYLCCSLQKNNKNKNPSQNLQNHMIKATTNCVICFAGSVKIFIFNHLTFPRESKWHFVYVYRKSDSVVGYLKTFCLDFYQ